MSVAEAVGVRMVRRARAAGDAKSLIEAGRVRAVHCARAEEPAVTR